MGFCFYKKCWATVIECKGNLLLVSFIIQTVVIFKFEISDSVYATGGKLHYWYKTQYVYFKTNHLKKNLFCHFRNNVIPIVMGAHPDDYKKLAPPHSFIHVDEFDSPRELAEYMNILDNNDELYNAYFRWKGTGEFMDTKFICRLCAMVQLAPSFPMWYKNVNDWWKDDACVVATASGRWATWKGKLNSSLHGIISG